MNLIQSAILSAISMRNADLAVAAANASEGAANDYGVACCYTETDTRSKMRAFLDGASLTNSVVRLGFIKVCGEVRYMVARPCLGIDGTNQFYTVVDLELTQDAGRTMYRRVNLDAIAAAQVEFHAAAA